MNNASLVYTLQEVSFIAKELHALMDTVQVFTFTGSLGAGKTTLIQEVLKQKGIEEAVQSPTFNYVSVYTNARGQTFYHFDLYRIDSLQHFKEQGFQEYLYNPESWAFIEWPEIIMPLLKKNLCICSLQVISPEVRHISYSII